MLEAFYSHTPFTWHWDKQQLIPKAAAPLRHEPQAEGPKLGQELPDTGDSVGDAETLPTAPAGLPHSRVSFWLRGGAGFAP